MPFYNEEEIFPLLRPRLTEFLDQSPYLCEVIAVNDGSSDRTIEELVAWSKEEPRIKVVNLSRNFGHQYASTAGVDNPRWRRALQEVDRLGFLPLHAHFHSGILAAGRWRLSPHVQKVR